jgi:hypothetical protein
MAENSRTKLATKETDAEAGLLLVSFAHGEDLSISLSEVPEKILTELALHGLSQKVGDSYSGEKDPQEAKAKAEDVIDRLKSGDWVKARLRGEGSTSLTVEAIAAIKGKSVSAIKEVWAGLPEDTKKAVRNDPAIKAKMAAIKAERLQSKADEASDSEEGALSAFGP